MSGVLMHFWMLQTLLPAGWGLPNRKGTRGCMPAVVNKTVGSFSGINDEDGRIEWPFEVKKSRYSFCKSRVFICLKG